MVLSDQTSSMTIHTLPGPLRMIAPPHAEPASSVQPAPLSSVPATHTANSTESLQPVPRLSPSAIERCLAIFAPKDWCVITVPLRSGAPIRLKDHQRKVVLPICRHGNYWIVALKVSTSTPPKLKFSTRWPETIPFPLTCSTYLKVSQIGCPMRSGHSSARRAHVRRMNIIALYMSWLRPSSG